MVELVFIWMFGIVCGLVIAWDLLMLVLAFPLGLLQQRDYNAAINSCADDLDP